MLAETRRDLILHTLSESGQVATEELALQLDVSVETIRRDLHVLARREALQRVRGGAVPIARPWVQEPPYRDRREVAAEQKAAIGEFVAGLIPAGATVFLDLGTTVDAVVAALPTDLRGTFLTTSLRAAIELSRLADATILITGGRLRREELSVSGALATETLASFHPDIAIISAGAVNADAGITDFDLEEVQPKRLMLANAGESYVVVDQTKFGEVAPYTVCPLTTPTHLITNSSLAAECQAAMRRAGAQLLLA